MLRVSLVLGMRWIHFCIFEFWSFGFMVQGLVLEEESVWFLLRDLAVEGSEFEVGGLRFYRGSILRFACFVQFPDTL